MIVENNNTEPQKPAENASAEPGKVDPVEPTTQVIDQPSDSKPAATAPAQPDLSQYVSKADYDAAQAELTRLKAIEKKANDDAEAARQAQLTKEQQLSEQLENERKARIRAERSALISQYNVPEALKALIPEGDVESLKTYLDSDGYKAVKAALEKPSQPVQPPTNTEPKATDPEPDAKDRKPVDQAKAAKWTEIKADDLITLGRKFTGVE